MAYRLDESANIDLASVLEIISFDGFFAIARPVALLTNRLDGVTIVGPNGSYGL